MANNQHEPMPAFYISHGGGPCFFMEEKGGMFEAMDKNSKVTQWYKDFAKNFIPRKPKAIVLFSAHWEEKPVHIISSAKPGLLYDYYGFPAHTYEITYPAPGEPNLAQRISNLLNNVSIPNVLDTTRDWDHGVFIPLKLIYPDADIPIVEVSLMSGLSPGMHIKIGEALNSLRYEDVLFIGSGAATHNLRQYGSNSDWVHEWNAWLTDTLTNKNLISEQRKERLLNWSTAPSARIAHPREEHLIPLHVVFGTAAEKPAQQIYDVLIGTFSFATFKFL